MTDNLFNETPAATVVTTPAADPLLASITDETGKQKYASVEAALAALAHAQNHIKTIETENSQLREATTKAKTLEDILQAIKPSEAVPAPAVAPVQTEAVDIAGLVKDTVLSIETQRKQEANVQTVVDKIKKVYGEAASDTFYTKAAELGFSKEGINKLARENPTAVLKLLGVEDKAPTKPPMGSIRTDAFLSPPNTPQTRSGMAHGNTKQMVDAWRAAAQRANEKLGINN